MRELSFWRLINAYQIRIPIIQRDYAQGRVDSQVVSVRDGFLRNLYTACKGRNVLRLDFIFGEEDGHVLLPFDGQQRLTTLYLLHWYAAARNNALSEEVINRLGGFRYEVRDGARLFGQELVHRSIPEDHPVRMPYDEAHRTTLSDYMRDQAWFRPQWEFDPTITGMLTMLDDIHGHFHDLVGLWDTLTEKSPPITFYFEALSDLAMSSDEIFIKMNARGKQLTEFEHFKARFVEHLQRCDVPEVRAISLKFDNQWTDLFWKVFAENSELTDKAAEADRCFVAYLRYLTDIFLRWPENANKELLKDLPDSDAHDLFACMVIAQKEKMPIYPGGNIAFLVNTLDKLAAIADSGTPGDSINAFFDEYFAAASADSLPVPEKISMFSNTTNLFLQCCSSNRFGQGDRLLFFACLLVLVSELPQNKAAQRLRTLRNILENSVNELRDEFFPEQLFEVRNFILDGTLDSKSAFNRYQVAEEQEKLRFRLSCQGDLELLEAIDYLEDHTLLRGRLAIFSEREAPKEQLIHFKKHTICRGQRFFRTAFGLQPVSYDVLIRSLLSQGDYAYRLGDQRVYLGKEGDNAGKLSRREIFTTMDKRSFDQCRYAVQRLAELTFQCSGVTEVEEELTKTADEWLKDCENTKNMDWRYYFVKYEDMRPQEDESSIYFWGYSKQRFNQLKLVGATRQSQNWNPFLWSAVVEAGHNDNYEGIDSWGMDTQPLIFPRSNLALWWGEFSWHVGSPAGNRKLGPKQSEYLKRLREKLTQIDDEGWLAIPGKDSHAEIDYKNPETYHHRLHDSTNRIALVLPLIKAMMEIENE